jgi:peptidoglycan/LPS O-acetylase OafA/YrhL
VRATLGDALAGRNALTSTRLVLACLVLTSHTWPVGGFGTEPHLGDLTLGTFALYGFFSISGYLLAGSRTRLPLWQFLLRRAARIYPGLWVALGVTAFVAAPLGALAGGGHLDVTSAAGFVVRNATGHLAQPGISGQLADVPAAEKWNIPIWTLEYELLCYLLVALLFSAPALRRHPRATSAVALSAATVVNLALARGAQLPHHERLSTLCILFGFFAAGMVAWSLRSTIRPEPKLAVAVALATAGAALIGMTTVLSPLPVAVLVLCVAVLSPVARRAERDLSLGVYVYGWPVQQLLVLVGADSLGPWIFTACALALSLLVAYGSWTVVERPAIAWARARRGPGLRQRPVRSARSATCGDTAGSSPSPSAR